MKILAIDAATTLGWATNAAPENIANTHEFKLPRGASPGCRWQDFRHWLVRMIGTFQPELVVYEQPIIGQMRSGTAAEIAYGMCTRIQEICVEQNVEYRPVNLTTIKQFATGAGNAKKEAVIAAAAAKWPGYDPQSDPGGDEADARWLLAYASAGFPVLESAADRKKREAKERREAKRR